MTDRVTTTLTLGPVPSTDTRVETFIQKAEALGFAVLKVQHNNEPVVRVHATRTDDRRTIHAAHAEQF